VLAISGLLRNIRCTRDRRPAGTAEGCVLDRITLVHFAYRVNAPNLDEKNREAVLVIHWVGGRHSELRVKKFETGRSRRCTDPEAIEVLRQMAGKFSDRQIAATMNRLRLRTGVGNSWNEMRVRSARSYYQLPAFREDDQAKAKEVTVKIAAQQLNVSEWIVRRMIEEKILPARQVIVCAPWQIPVEALDSEEIRQQATNIKNGLRVPQNRQNKEQEVLFSET
jgi:hypothetical protein